MGRADVIVVGLGAVGSATLLHLARRGVRVIGIDRADPPHELGSTHGESRVTRQATAEGAAYVPLAVRSQELWREVEAETGADLFTACGVLMAGARGRTGTMHGVPDWVDETATLAHRFGIEHEVLDGPAARRRFPMLALGDDDVAYHEPGGGFVRPEAAVAAQLGLARGLGAQVRTGEVVLGVRQHGDHVEVVTDRETLVAEHAVLSAGPWIGDLLEDAAGTAGRLRVLRQELHWFAVDPARAALAEPEACPVFMWSFGPGEADFFYGFPALAGTEGGVKVATEQFATSTTIDALDRTPDPEAAASMYETHLRGRLLTVTTHHLRSRVCAYTATGGRRLPRRAARRRGPHPARVGLLRARLQALRRPRRGHRAPARHGRRRPAARALHGGVGLPST
ncbi:MAG: dadA [Thermoleophilia bacterium]|nr:dadA [Thermoleophilia bacterium]